MNKPNRKWIFFDSFSKTQSNPVSTEDAQLAIFKMSERDTERFFIWTAGWEKWQPLKAYLSSTQKIFFSSLQAAMKSNLPEETMTAFKTVKAREREVLEMKPAKPEVESEITRSSRSITNFTKSTPYSRISLQEEDIEAPEENAAHSEGEGQFDGDDITFSKIEKPKVNFKSLNSKGLKDRSDRHELKIEILLIHPKGKTFRSRSQNISMSGSLLQDNIPFEYSGVTFDVVVINSQPSDPQFQRVSLKGKTIGDGITRRIHYVNINTTVKKALQGLLEAYLQAQDQHKNKKKVG